MASRWALPAAAGAFWLGVLGAGTRSRPVVAPALLLLGVAGLVAAGSWGRGGRARSRRLVAAAVGLLPPPEPIDPRGRIVAAAGLPAGEADGGGRSRRRPVARWVVALASCAFIGVGWASVRVALRPRLGPLEGRHVAFRGTSISDLRRFDWGWGVEVGVEGLGVEGRWAAVDVRVWASGSGRGPSVEAGQPVSGAGTFWEVDPGASGFDSYLLSRGVAGRASWSRLTARGPPHSAALRLANAARGALRRGACVALPGREAALLLGLSIGDTSEMDPEVEEDFRASGLAHLVAVSGSNVAMFLAPVLAMAGRFRLRLRTRVAVGVAAIAFFALLTRWEPSVLRATAMAVVALAGVWAGRPRSTGALLGASVLALLVADPWLARSVGFQLSVAATAGLALLAGPLAARLRALPRPLALAAAATASAQLGVTPLLLLHFGIVPTVTLLANLLAFPAVALALLGGLAASLGALAWAPLGGALGTAAALPLAYLIGLADRMARLPLPSLAGGGAAAVLASTALALLVAWRLRRGRRRVGAAAVALSLAAMAWAWGPTAGPPAALTVTFLDVGQGDAAVVRTPEGVTVVIDAGPDPDQVAVELARLGVRRIDLAVASHAHADHVEGFPAVFARFPVGLLLDPGCPGDSPSYRKYLAAVRAEDVPMRHARGGDRYGVGGLVIEVLGPDRCSAGGSSPNDDSLVLRLRFGDAVILFPGDAEVPAQRDLLEDGDPVTAAVLKVPHHGGNTSDPAFFDAVDAAVAVVSTGPNDYGHPHPSALAALRVEGMAVYRTDLLGDVTVRFTPEGVLVESAPG